MLVSGKYGERGSILMDTRKGFQPQAQWWAAETEDVPQFRVIMY